MPPYPNALQRLVLTALAETSLREGRILSDTEAARRCDLTVSTFSQIVRTRFAGRQRVDPDRTLPRLIAGLRLPELDVHTAAALAAGYRILPRIDEHDIVAEVQRIVSGGLDDRQTRETLREIRDVIEAAFDRWCELTAGGWSR